MVELLNYPVSMTTAFLIIIVGQLLSIPLAIGIALWMNR